MFPAMLPLLIASSLAFAAPHEIIVAGLHVHGAGDAEADAQRLEDALEATGLVNVPSRDELAKRLAGREALVLDGWALGAGKERLNEGRVLYDRAAPDEAIEVLEDAVKLLAQGLATSTDTRPLHEALVTLGMCRVGLGDEDGARNAFRRAVTLDPSRRLDALNYAPDTISLYEAERTAVTGAPKATVDIVLEDAPEATRAWLDGRELGTLPTKVQLVPGTHYLLVRAPDGSSRDKKVQVASGDKRSVDVSLQARTLGAAMPDAAGRARQTRDLYRSLGQHAASAPIVLAGALPDGKVALQLYDPASGTFSRTMSADAGDDPVGAIADLSGAIVGYLQDGRLRADRVAPQALALDVSANELLAELLLAPRAPVVDAPPPQVITERKGIPWYAWTGIGLVAAGGGAAATWYLTQPEAPTGPSGTVVVGPLP